MLDTPGFYFGEQNEILDMSLNKWMSSFFPKIALVFSTYMLDLGVRLRWEYIPASLLINMMLPRPRQGPVAIISVAGQSQLQSDCETSGVKCLAQTPACSMWHVACSLLIAHEERSDLWLDYKLFLSSTNSVNFCFVHFETPLLGHTLNSFICQIRKVKPCSILKKMKKNVYFFGWL